MINEDYKVFLLTTLLFALIFSVLFLELVLLATLLLGISSLLLAFLQLHQCQSHDLLSFIFDLSLDLLAEYMYIGSH